MTQPDSLPADAASAGPAAPSELDRLAMIASSFPLPVFRQNYRHVRDRLHAQTRSLWLQGGPTLPTAQRIATAVTGGQQMVSHMAQLYARDSLGARFTPFDPGPGITDRPGVDKVEEYLRPAREVDTGKALRRLGTLVATDLQLTKTRTFYSAFDEDINSNRKSIKLYRRVPGGEKPCGLCEIAADQVYFTDDLMAIHDNCECDIEEDDGARITDDMAKKHHIGFVETLIDSGDMKKVFQSLADDDAPPEAYHNLVKIEQHGELGPVLTWKGQKFTGPGDLPNPVKPRGLPVLNTGWRNEERMQDNRARVESYRRQHGLAQGMNPDVPQAKKPKPKQMGELGRTSVTMHPDGTLSFDEPAPHELPPVELDKPLTFDWEHEGKDGSWTTGDLKDSLAYMREKYGRRMGLDPFNPSSDGWTSTRYPVEAQRRTLQAIDEMMTKYPNAIVRRFKIANLGDGTAAETMARLEAPGETEYIGFSRAAMQQLPSELKATFKDAERRGFYFAGASDDPYRAMVYHEFAHALDNRGGWAARMSMNKDMGKLFFQSRDGKALIATPGGPQESDIKRHFTNWMRYPDRVSGYSMEDGGIPGDLKPGAEGDRGLRCGVKPNPPEAIAQAFDDVERRGNNASDLSKLLHDRVIEEANKPLPEEWAKPPAGLSLKQSAVQRLEKLKPIKREWADEEYAKEDNFSLPPEKRAACLAAAKSLVAKAIDVEPAITAAARSTVEHQGGFMSGLDFRIKTGPSLYRKIQAGLVENKAWTVDIATADIKDAVRYTGIFSPQGYWKSSDELRDALTSVGAKVVKDPIGVPLLGYRGRNMAFKLDGLDFEMQTNTELGIAVKDECHQIYNVSRKLDIDPDHPNPVEAAEKEKLNHEMQTKWDAIPITEGTPVVPTEKLAKKGGPKDILYVAKDTKYRGPTVPGGEAELGSPEMLARERVPSSQFGMNWLPDTGNAKVVARARELPDKAWDELPIEHLPLGTPIEANEGTLKKKSIDKVTSGKEPFREGYVIKLWRDDKGRLHVVDGHTRVAMYHVLGKEPPVRIMDEDSYHAALDRVSPTPWKDEQYHVEDKLERDKDTGRLLTDDERSRAMDLAKDIYRASVAAEPDVTAAAVKAVEAQGGKMSGLQYRLKTGPSLYRKVQSLMLENPTWTPESAAADIKDSIRYTALYDPEGYWQSSDKLRDALKDIGCDVVKDPVGVPLLGYRGRNMGFRYKGVVYEMQTNTELGIATKDECHEIYDVTRNMQKTDPERKRLEQVMQEKWDAIPITEGTPVVATEKDAKLGDPNKVLYVADSTKYRGDTIPGKELPLNAPEMIPRARYPSSQFGLDWLPGYNKAGAKVVARAREMSDADWDTLPITTIKHGTPIRANEGTLKKKSIDKVVGGKEAFREGYVARLWRDQDGDLHVVDGHHRVAMHNALGKDMQAHIMDEDTYQRIIKDRNIKMLQKPLTATELRNNFEAVLAGIEAGTLTAAPEGNGLPMSVNMALNNIIQQPSNHASAILAARDAFTSWIAARGKPSDDSEFIAELMGGN